MCMQFIPGPFVFCGKNNKKQQQKNKNKKQKKQQQKIKNEQAWVQDLVTPIVSNLIRTSSVIDACHPRILSFSNFRICIIIL